MSARRSHHFWSWLFGEPEAINGDGRVTEYLYRWTLARLRGWRLYLHHFVGPDWARDLHDHPKRFWSLGLKGGYVEEVAVEIANDHQFMTTIKREYRAPWLRSWRPMHVHRLVSIIGGSCWTLVLVGPTEREWGFYTADGWVRADKYVARHGGAPTTYCKRPPA